MAIKYRENIPLAPLTTFKIGGNARLFVEAESDSIVEEVFSENKGGDVFVLGGGSNVLISDIGFDGVVVKIATKGIRTEERSNDIVRVTAKAGEDWDDFVEHCVGLNLAGLECLSGIPGLVGGTPIQNVGAYGQEVSESVVSVRVLERTSGKIFEISAADCGFEYRKSIFNSSEKDRYVVLDVTFDLVRNGSPKIVYGDLKALFGDEEADLAAVREGVKSIRASKGMLVRQGGIDANSAGSFFKNPVVDEGHLNSVGAGAVEFGMIENAEQMPRFETGSGFYKIPAAWLIEKSGFAKGFVYGNAGISGKHSLALINRGGASAVELIALKEKIQAVIQKNFGIELVQEPNLIGFGEAV